MLLANSPIEQKQLLGLDVFIKRDDLLHPVFGGNKARKFSALLAMDFSDVDTLIGYGSAQANSLFTMASLAELKGCQLEFYVDHISPWLKNNPNGNYRAALELGARIIEVGELDDREGLSVAEYIAQKVLPYKQGALFVPEGGRCHLAASGVEQLALELAEWQQAQSKDKVRVVLPSGTGTTALFLSRYFFKHQLDIRVLTVPAVGGDDYLRLQFNELEADSSLHPDIVELGRKYHFGKLYPEFITLWQQACACGVEFELLYDPVGLMALQQAFAAEPDATWIYIHQGGVLGNETMLPRYRRKFPGLFVG